MRIKDIAPIILTVTSVITSVGAVIMAIHDTPRAIDILDTHRLEIDPYGETDLTTSEKMKDYAKGYWRTGALLGISVTTSIASCVVGRMNYRALAATTATLTAAYAKHKDKVKKFVGEEKAKLIDQAVKDEMLADSKKNPSELAWFYDTVSDTYFQMTWQEYWDAKLTANRDLNTFGEISLGDMYPNISKYLKDKKAAEWEWFVDDVVETYGYPWLDITEELYNAPGSESQENGKYDNTIRDGKPTWVIRYGIWPLPPEVAKDYQYIGYAEKQITA